MLVQAIMLPCGKSLAFSPEINREWWDRAPQRSTSFAVLSEGRLVPLRAKSSLQLKFIQSGSDIPAIMSALGKLTIMRIPLSPSIGEVDYFRFDLVKDAF